MSPISNSPQIAEVLARISMTRKAYTRSGHARSAALKLDLTGSRDLGRRHNRTSFTKVDLVRFRTLCYTGSLKASAAAGASVAAGPTRNVPNGRYRQRIAQSGAAVRSVDL